MAEYLTNDVDLTAIANAIRTKGGTSAQLEYPDGFVTAIENLSTGSGAVTIDEYADTNGGTVKDIIAVDISNDTVTAAALKKGYTAHGADGTAITGTLETEIVEKDVVFIDYDGRIVASKTIAEINAMTDGTDLPANPTHEGLIAQGWNWTVAQLKAQLLAMPEQTVYVGQMYTTVSGATEIDVEMQEGRLDPILTICPNGTISVDWGDGTTPDSVTGSSTTTRQAVSHTYASAGNYTIKISKTSGTNYGLYCDQSYTLLRKNTTQNQNHVYAKTIKRIRIGADISYITGSFHYCSSLSSITIPSSVAYIDTNAFTFCYSLSSVTIPSGVARISASAFYNCFSLSSISIPSSVTYIGSSVFYYCLSLSSISIPSSVTFIGSNAFNCCSTLSSITIPSGVTEIKSNMFYDCYALKSVTIPSNVTIIEDGAFQYCNSLSSITIPSGVTSIAQKTFYGCYALKSITIPSGVTSIAKQAFYNCNSLSSITIPSSVASIGENAFYGCLALKSITIPSGVTSFDIGLFQNCNSLSSVTIPSTVTSIGKNAFNYCYALTSITIPSSVTSIGNSTFSSCYSLSNLTIPSSVTSIDGNAFAYCYGMKEYHFQRTTPPTLGTSAFSSIVSDCIIYVPYSADHSILEAYQTETNWSEYASYMQEEPQ